MVNTRIEIELGAGRIAVYRRLHVIARRDGDGRDTALGSGRASQRKHRHKNQATDVSEEQLHIGSRLIHWRLLAVFSFPSTDSFVPTSAINGRILGSMAHFIWGLDGVGGLQLCWHGEKLAICNST